MPRKLRFRPAPPRPPLSEAQILAWADAFRDRTGRWPTRKDKSVGLPDTNWSALDQCLKAGLRGLPGGSSLAKLLLRRRGRRHKGCLPHLTTTHILAWADDHHARTGDWPGQHAGPVAAAPGETWAGVDRSLAVGGRGLPGHSTLADLLAEQREVRNCQALPALSIRQILTWADEFHDRTGEWPTRGSGPLADASGETWNAVDRALAAGGRSLPVLGSLTKLLAEARGVRHRTRPPRLSPPQILAWADDHRLRTGRWPTAESGPVSDTTGETWAAVDYALRGGLRGLAPGGSLARLLAHDRGVRNMAARPQLSVAQILAWADEFRSRTGRWPARWSGLVGGDSDETWTAVDSALKSGRRGLPGGSSLAAILAESRGRRSHAAVPPLSEDQILEWADEHRTRTGAWPGAGSGPIVGELGETWSAVNAALRAGTRGLSGGMSLARLLAERRGARNHAALPPLTARQILAWADEHRSRTGRWPSVRAGAVAGVEGQTWLAVDNALRLGARGLAGGDSLSRLLARHRPTR